MLDGKNIRRGGIAITLTEAQKIQQSLGRQLEDKKLLQDALKSNKKA